MSTRAGSNWGLAKLRRENRRLRGRLSQLSNLSRRITSSLDLGTVLQDIVDAASDLTGARYGAVAVFDDAGQVRTFVTHGITESQREQLGNLPKGLGLLGLLQKQQMPLRLSDLSQHPQSIGFPPNHPPMKSFLGAPIRLDGESLGNLYLTEKVDDVQFTAEDEDVLVLFASHAALAIHNAQQYEALENERRRLESLVRLSPVAVLMIEAGSERVLVANREAERILGFSFGPGSALRDAGASDQDGAGGPVAVSQAIDEAHPIFRALVDGEVVRAEEVAHNLADGLNVLTLVSATPIYGEGGEISAAVSIIQDISPLEELERLKSEFLGIVSHELRTPLTAIKGSAATVLGSPHPLDEKEIHEFFEIIDEQADRMRDLINNLLDMTRIEAGTLSVNPESCDLGEALEAAKLAFARSGGYQEIVIDLPDGPTDRPPMVRADRRRLDQVLSNLLGNAGKFAPEDSLIAIEVETGPENATIHVRDQGRGLGPASLSNVFQKFFQARGESGAGAQGTGLRGNGIRGNGIRGTGLGLAICKGIVEAHGGRIWASSPGEGQGATFSFTLLLDHETGLALPAPVSRQSHHMGRVAQGGTKTRVLAVDDEPQVLRHLQNILGQAGYHPIVTDNPDEVIRLAELEEPQVVLLDLLFPGASGFDVLERIREISGVPVIFLTARDNEEDAVRALRLGADDYITKPFSASELLARVEASLRRRVLPDQLEVRPPLAFEDMVIDYAARHVSVSGDEVPLTPTEYKLLYELAVNAGRVLTNDQILQRVWGPDYSGESQLVRAIVRNLRRKLGDDARNPRFIFTVPQVGYRMAGPFTP